MHLFNFAADQKRIGSPSWAKRVWKVLSPLFTEISQLPMIADPKDSDSLTSTYDFQNNPENISSMWKVFNHRKAVYRDIMRMDDEDEIISTALDIIADIATNFDQEDSSGMEQTTFRVKSANPAVQKEIDLLVNRLDINAELWQWIREFVKHGNYLPEVILDRKTNNIVRVKQTIQYQIFYRATPKGDRLPGWIVMEEKDVYNTSGGQELEDWQILPFCFGAKHGFLAKSMLEAVRRNWIRLSLIEDSMAIARLERAYDKHVHRIPVKKEWDAAQIQATIKRYKDSMTRRKLVTTEGEITQNENPVSVSTDFYLPDDGSSTGGISVLNATNLQLGNLNDIYYHRERIICRLRVPMQWLQITSSMKTHLKAGGMSGADIQFAALMRRVIATAKGGLKRLIDMQLMLKGINPGDPKNAYEIEMAKIDSKDPLEDAKTLLTRGQAAVYFVEAFGALPADLLTDVFFDLTPDQQALIKSFLLNEGPKILESRVAAIALEAEPPPTPAAPVFKSGPKMNKNAGSGNNNKSMAKRSSEQKGGSKQSVSVEVVAKAVYYMQQAIATRYQEMGVDVPDLDNQDLLQIQSDIVDSLLEDEAE